MKKALHAALPFLLLAACSQEASDTEPSAAARTAPAPQAASAPPAQTAARSVVGDKHYSRDLNHPFVNPLDIFLIYLDAGSKAGDRRALQQQAQNKAGSLLDEYRRTGKIVPSALDYDDPAALAEFRIRLGAQADLGYFVFKTGKASFKTDGQGQVITAERSIAKEMEQTQIKYTYWNGQPFSVSLIYSDEGKKREGMQTFLYRNGAWQPLHPAAPLPDAYADCAPCTQEAQDLLLKEKIVRDEDPDPERDALKHTQAAATHNNGLIDKRNLPELMLEGATRNSVTLGYDRQGRPEKLYYSFGSNYRVHSYQFYFRDGKPSSAQADAIYYRPDGSIDTAKTARTQNILFDNEGAVAADNTVGSPPERPIRADNWQTEVRLVTAIAEKHR